MNAPPVRLPERVRAELEAHRPGLSTEMEAALFKQARPCVRITSERASATPLRGSRGIVGLFARTPGPPLLPVTASKFGGSPYSEGDEDWSRWGFLGQIDLAEATAVLPHGAPRLSGLLRIDCATLQSAGVNDARVRWFPTFTSERAVAVNAPSYGGWEARMRFTLGWTSPGGRALEEIWPLKDGSLYDDPWCLPGYNNEPEGNCHRLLGHKTAALDDPYPPTDLSGDDLFLRLSYDHAADFAWGSNAFYLVVPRDDLARGDLSRITPVAANY